LEVLRDELGMPMLFIKKSGTEVIIVPKRGDTGKEYEVDKNDGKGVCWGMLGAGEGDG
jgi:hypothetical protein